MENKENVSFLQCIKRVQHWQTETRHNGSLYSNTCIPTTTHAGFLPIPTLRVTGELVPSVPAQAPRRFREVPKHQVSLRGFINCIDFFVRFRCDEQSEEELQTSTASDSLGEPLDDYLWLRPTWNFATQSVAQTLGRGIFNPSPRQNVEQDTKATIVRLWTLTPSLESALCW